MTMSKDDPSFLKAGALLSKHYTGTRAGAETFLMYHLARRGLGYGSRAAELIDRKERAAMEARWRSARSRKGWRTRRARTRRGK